MLQSEEGVHCMNSTTTTKALYLYSLIYEAHATTKDSVRNLIMEDGYQPRFEVMLTIILLVLSL